MSRNARAGKLLYALTDVDDEFIAEAGEATQVSAQCGHRKPFNRALRYAAAAAACFAVVLIATHVISIHREARIEQEGLLIDANPFDEATTLAEAEKTTGFGMRIPEAIRPYDEMSVTVVDGSLIEVRYITSDGSAMGYDIRKAAGESDISGDYNEYENEAAVFIGGRTVTLKGDDGTWSVATWTANGYSYAIGAQYDPMTLEEITALIDGTE